jgi:hypothetical protein
MSSKVEAVTSHDQGETMSEDEALKRGGIVGGIVGAIGVSVIVACLAGSRFPAKQPESMTNISVGPTTVYLVHSYLPELPIRVPRSAFEYFPGTQLHRRGFTIRMPITPNPACNGLNPFAVSIGQSTPDFFERFVSDDMKTRKIPIQKGVKSSFGFMKYTDPNPIKPIYSANIYLNQYKREIIECTKWDNDTLSDCRADIEYPISGTPKRSLILYLAHKSVIPGILYQQISCTESQKQYFHP